ncbi:MAG: IS110 family transposase [Thioalkalivibrio sp.]|nr:IS110 family transposase [Thioalkalivibrio sp.]
MSIIHWIGIDDHADKWTIAHVKGSAEVVEKAFELVPSESGYRKLISYLKSLEGEVRVVYEAGPCGYELYRRLAKAGLDCRVAAPALTPRKPGDRVKTNRRDAVKLARYYRSGHLTLIAVPDPSRESLRDLVRARQAVQADLVSIRNQIGKFLLRYGHRYREGRAWTVKFWAWLHRIRLEGDYSQDVLLEMITAHEQRLAQLQRYDERIEQAAQRPEYAPYIAALGVLRGISTLSAMTILSELGDLRRFASASQLMAAVGLVPSEYSTGDTTSRFTITKAGNAHVRHVVVEAAWQYRRRMTRGRLITKRRKDQPQALVAIAEKCDHRLRRKFSRMTSRNKPSTVAAVAVARELVGFIWAVGQVAHP